MTFRNIRTGKIVKKELFLFFICPIIIGIYSVYFDDFTYSNDYTNILIASISILAGFLFNLLALALVFGFIDKIVENADGNEVKIKLTKEIHSNISFTILLSIACIISLLLCGLRKDWLKLFFNAVAVSITLAFFLSLLMILKRIYILMSKEI